MPEYSPIVGVCGLSFSTGVTRANVADHIRDFRESGIYELPGRKALEIFVSHGANGVDLDGPSDRYLGDFEYIAETLESEGIERVVIAFHGPNSGANISSTDPVKRRTGFNRNERGLEIANVMKAISYIGPTHIAHTDGEVSKVYLVDGLRRLNESTTRYGVPAFPELLTGKEDPGTSYEDMVEALIESGLKLHGDTKHILDKSGKLIPSIKYLIGEGLLGHLHICESDDWLTERNRGLLKPGGKVHDQLPDLFSLLIRERFEGPITEETPVPDFYSAVGRAPPKEMDGRWEDATFKHDLAVRESQHNVGVFVEKWKEALR